MPAPCLNPLPRDWVHFFPPLNLLGLTYRERSHRTFSGYRAFTISCAIVGVFVQKKNSAIHCAFMETDGYKLRLVPVLLGLAHLVAGAA